MGAQATPLRPHAPSKTGLTAAWREALWGYAFISPWVVGFLAFSLFPIAAVLYFGFTEYNILDEASWVGLANYRKMFTDDPLFWKSLGNTAYYVGLRVPLHVGLGFFLALLLNRNVRGIAFFRTAVYLPMVIPAVVNAVLWLWILQPQVGILHYVQDVLHLPHVPWLQSEVWAKPAIIMMSLWHVGSIMMVFLAGLQGIPQQLYEAATIDGASPVRQLWSITIPMMTPTILFNVVMDIINSFQVFAAAFIMTRGGPLNSTLFYVLYIYRNAFEYFEMGYASALATVLFVLMLGATLLIFRSSRSWVHYDQV